ncbi:MAG: ABC-2 transporter permease [Peptococcaceae bacterium]|nr:ABC-2 transporter permease [Peptococcaceae bacterium]
MKGLLLKDFYLVRAGLALILIAYAVIGAGMSVIVTPWVVVLIGAVMFGIMSATTISTDKHSGWRKLSATLPVSKQTAVDSKYLLYVLFSVLGFVVGIVISLIIVTIKPDTAVDADMIRLYLSIAVTMAFFSGGVMILSYYLFSDEKAMVSMMLSYPLMTGIFIAVARITDDRQLTTMVLLVFSLAFFVLSWLFARTRIAARDVL